MEKIDLSGVRFITNGEPHVDTVYNRPLLDFADAIDTHLDNVLAQLNSASIVHAPGSSLPNEAGTIYSYNAATSNIANTAVIRDASGNFRAGTITANLNGNATTVTNGVYTSRSILTGTGLSGGGNLSADRTLSVKYGTTAGTAAQGNDPRITGAVQKSTQVIAGTGLSGGGNLSADRTLSVKYGTTAGTAAQGNDSRITGAAQKSANLSDLASASAARQNLGLGSAATRDVGESSGNVMEVGAFGFGLNAQSITSFSSTSDWSKPSGWSGFIGKGNAPAWPPGAGTLLYYTIIAKRDVANGYGALAIDYSNGNSWIGFSGSASVNPTWREIHHTGNIQSTTGQSTQYPMSQKAVTDAINGKSLTGSITLNGTTNNTVVMTGIVTELELEVGDVIRINTGAYNKLHTVESITNNSSIIVNYEHAGNRGNGSLKLPNFTGQATVTRIAKWFNAPLGLGQGLVNVTGYRARDVAYTNSSGRLITVAVRTFGSFTVNSITIGATGLAGQSYIAAASIPPGNSYIVSGGNITGNWVELR